MTSLIEQANTAQLAIDAPFDSIHAGNDEVFARMTEAGNASEAIGVDFGMSGLGGDTTDDTCSWLLDQHVWGVDAAGSTFENLWFEDEMEIAAANRGANTMDASACGGTPDLPLTGDATSQDSPPSLSLDDDTTHQKSPSSPPLSDEVTGQDSPSAEDTHYSLADDATSQDSPPSLSLSEHMTNQQSLSSHPLANVTSQGSPFPEGTPSCSLLGHEAISSPYSKPEAHHTTAIRSSRIVIVIDDSGDE
ncbi:hypothetical protein ACEPPN_000318 [Leptodophora sp. 'Broadleaf-Isolate-01']